MKSRKRRERRYHASAPLLPRRLPRPRVEIDRGLAWFVVWSGNAPKAKTRLDQSGVALWRPSEAVERVQRGRKVEVEQFPAGGYLFVGLDSADPDFNRIEDALSMWEFWGAVPRLGRFLRSSDFKPIRVPVSALQRLADGLVCFEAARQPFLPGASVRAVSGAFSGFLAEVERADDIRVRALVHLFGGQVRAEFEPGQLEAA
jgi:transcription antitermination factor NusG